MSIFTLIIQAINFSPFISLTVISLESILIDSDQYFKLIVEPLKGILIS